MRTAKLNPGPTIDQRPICDRCGTHGKTHLVMLGLARWGVVSDVGRHLLTRRAWVVPTENARSVAVSPPRHVGRRGLQRARTRWAGEAGLQNQFRARSGLLAPAPCSA